MLQIVVTSREINMQYNTHLKLLVMSL